MRSFGQVFSFFLSFLSYVKFHSRRFTCIPIFLLANTKFDKEISRLKDYHDDKVIVFFLKDVSAYNCKVWLNNQALLDYFCIKSRNSCPLGLGIQLDASLINEVPIPLLFSQLFAFFKIV